MKLSLTDHELPNKRLPTVAIQYNKGRFFWQWILHLIGDILYLNNILMMTSSNINFFALLALCVGNPLVTSKYDVLS